MSLEMKNYCKSNSIRHQTSCARTPQQNGLVERRNKSILEIVHASLFDMKVPRQYWGEAVRSAAYIMNRTPSKVIEFVTPIQKLHDIIGTTQKQNLEPRVFGCTAYVHQSIGKLEPCSIQCVFIGYADLKKGYRCLDPSNNKVHVSCDVSFHESVPYFNHEGPLQGEKGVEVTPNETMVQGTNDGDFLTDFSDDIEAVNVTNPSDSDENETGPTDIGMNQTDTNTSTSETQGTQQVNQEPGVNIPSENENIVYDGYISRETESDGEVSNAEDVNTPRYPSRGTRGKPKRQYEPELNAKGKYPVNNYVSQHHLAKSHALLVKELDVVTIPVNVEEDFKDSRWKKAINDEMEALQKNNMWDLVNPPHGVKMVGCKWVFIVKLDAEGKVDRFKARLVAKGYT